MCEIARARAAPSGVSGGDDGALDGGWPARKSPVALADQVVRLEYIQTRAGDAKIRSHTDR